MHTLSKQLFLYSEMSITRVAGKSFPENCNKMPLYFPHTPKNWRGCGGGGGGHSYVQAKLLTPKQL